MKISFNPSNSNKNILDLIKNNKDIIFDLKGHSIFARGVEFKGTDTNTWRPVVDNLTSDSTTSSLSAKQGKVLKALIDGKSNSDHNHDGRYLKLTGGTMASNALITFADSGSWYTDKKPQGARGGFHWIGQSDYVKLYAEETAEDNLDLVIQFGDDNSNGLSIRNKANTQTSYISSSGVITTGTFKGNLDWSYITNKPATATRWPSWAEVTGKPSSFTPSTHTHGLANPVFFLNMPNINGNAKWKEAFGYPVNCNLLLSVRVNNPAPEWCVGDFCSGILYGGGDTKGFMSSDYDEPFIMWAGGNGSSADSVPKWYMGIKGTHKSIYNLATIASEANAAYNLRHSHANKSVLDGITSALVNSWNTAYNFVSNITGTDTDKVINKWEEIVNFLAGITEDNKLNTLLNSKLSVYELADNTNVGTIKNNGIYYSTTDASSRTLINSPFDTGFAFINMTSYDVGDDLRRSRLAFNVFGEIKVSDDRDQANTAETWYNVLTSKNSGINGSTIKLNGTSITVYSSGTADGRYVKKSGDTMSGVLTIDTPNFGALTIKRNDDTKGASIQFKGKSSIYGYIGLNNSAKDKQFLRWSSDTSRVYTILDTSSTYISNGKGVINGTTITQVDNATNSTNSTNARKLVNWYSARPTSLNTQFGDGSLRIFYATSSTTEGKPAEDSHILHLAWNSADGYDAQLAVHTRSGKVSTRAQNGGTWQPWRRLAFANEIPTSLKNPYALTISLNGTSQGPYDGSAAKNINITPGSIGAAVSNHSHDYLVVNSADDKSFNSAYHNFQILYAGGGNKITGKPANVDAFGLFKFRVASEWSGQMLLANGGSLYIRSSKDEKMTNTLAWKTILDSSNYSGILDSRYYTESEVNSLLDAKLNRQNLSYGNWNPRGYHFAADYQYNGGNLSISESGGKIHVSVNGYFWQNEGQYRVLDTSDIGDIRDRVTLHQYLSATDAAWYPLVWGRASHNNTSNSTGPINKSYNKLCWQTSSQTLYATNIQTNNIKNLSIEGGIYWNPKVESDTDNSDAASITLVRQGVAGGTTLVLSQMNDASDTIQFKTSTAARLYHNSYPILTTQNTYVSNNKGYINGLEITQVNNADTLDGEHASSFVRAGYYESQDLNKLDTYSFIRSVNSNVSSTSPKGNTGWYNVIQLVHKNGASDGPSYIGQIALGMTTNTDDMFFRGKRTDPWKTVIHSGNIGNQTVANAYHLRINSANSWSTWYWAGQSGQPSWLWGSNDGTNMYIWNPSNFNVNTAQYLRSLGNQNCQTGRTQAYGDVYSYNTDYGNTGFPATYSSVIGFGRGTSGTVEIAGGWCNTHLYWRSLRDCCDDWFPWRTVLDSSNYTEFINNYYWANVKISTSSSTTTSPTFSNVYLGNSLYLNNRGLNSIYNGPNDSANGVGGPLNNLVFSSQWGVSFTTSCEGETYTNKNAVSIDCRTGLLYAGGVWANGFIHAGHNNNDAVLLAGGGYRNLKDFMFFDKENNYTDNEHYNLAFHKLSNNLVWVDGHVKGKIAKSFVIDKVFFPFDYDHDYDLNTIYPMSGDSYITIDAIGILTINNTTDHKERVGFFYMGKD